MQFTLDIIYKLLVSYAFIFIVSVRGSRFHESYQS